MHARIPHPTVRILLLPPSVHRRPPPHRAHTRRYIRDTRLRDLVMSTSTASPALKGFPSSDTRTRSLCCLVCSPFSAHISPDGSITQHALYLLIPPGDTHAVCFSVLPVLYLRRLVLPLPHHPLLVCPPFHPCEQAPHPMTPRLIYALRLTPHTLADSRDLRTRIQCDSSPTRAAIHVAPPKPIHCVRTDPDVSSSYGRSQCRHARLCWITRPPEALAAACVGRGACGVGMTGAGRGAAAERRASDPPREARCACGMYTRRALVETHFARVMMGADVSVLVRRTPHGHVPAHCPPRLRVAFIPGEGLYTAQFGDAAPLPVASFPVTPSSGPSRDRLVAMSCGLRASAIEPPAARTDAAGSPARRPLPRTAGRWLVALVSRPRTAPAVRFILTWTMPRTSAVAST
ncbi:hypothetical protein C8J57DRAFT_1536061 [Mycena rebaudengoi]|nr:hypothetical protein C8J57DRAFT_1536061 [Mycena rebaudengoi]